MGLSAPSQTKRSALSSQSTRVAPDALTAQARPTEAPSSVPVPSSVRVMAETAASQPNSAPSSRRGLGSRPRPRRPRPSRRRALRQALPRDAVLPAPRARCERPQLGHGARRACGDVPPLAPVGCDGLPRAWAHDRGAEGDAGLPPRERRPRGVAMGSARGRDPMSLT